MEKLPEDFKQKWIAALRSGEYKQGDGYLECGGKYCCLGVAGVVAGVPKSDMSDVCYFSEHDAPFNYPQLLASGDARVNDLIEMNDEGTPFSEIADYIEQNL